jgi:outer membrane biosynthesis protein TonB
MINQPILRRPTAMAVVALIVVSASAATAQIDATRPKAPDEPPALALENKPDSAAGRAGTSRWIGYANETQARVDAYLNSRRETFGAKLNFSAELWVDAQGHITKTQLVSASGNAAFDAAARKNFAPGLVLPPPDKDMPLPIKVRATSR